MRRRVIRKAVWLSVASMAVWSIAVAGSVARANDESQPKIESRPRDLVRVPVKVVGTHHAVVGPRSYIPADQPQGSGATVTLVSLQRTSDLRNPVLSTFLVDFAPGGSAILHRAPSSGYVLLHVLSGAVTASAWEAQLGTYRTGETWAEPAFAYDITARNASTREPAEALVVLVTADVR